MIVDWDGRFVIVGADGSGRTAPFQSTAAGGSISQSISFSLGGTGGVSYQSLDFTVSAAGTLSGARAGSSGTTRRPIQMSAAA